MNADHNRDSEAVQVRPVGDSPQSRPAWLDAPMVEWAAPFVDGSPGTTTCTVPQWAVGRFKINRVTGCWEWQKKAMHNGYVRASCKCEPVLAHRGLVQHRLQRVLARTEVVCHHCDVRNCINPSHLFVGSQADNLRDAKNKGRLATGERSAARKYPERWIRGQNHVRSKTTDAEVVEAIALYKKIGNYSAVARIYGVSLTTMTRWVSGRSRRPFVPKENA